MSTDPLQVLKAQFAEFASSNLSENDWEVINREFGIHDKASSINRFYRSYHWSDPDMKKNTLRLLDWLQEAKGEDFMLQVMTRAYNKKGGASDNMLEEYPALTSLEGEEADLSADVPVVPSHSKEFISVENVPGTFYPQLIADINSTYCLGVYDATLVLSRKLIENLLIDILRKKYDTDRINLYYDTDTKQFENLNNLIENLENKVDEFEHYSDTFDLELISVIDEFRHTANRGAHSIELNLTESEMEDYSDKLEKVAPVLFRLSNQI